MSKESIITVVSRFRDAIEKYVSNKPIFILSSFPAGNCGHTSYMLGAYLHECGLGDFNYICGWKGEQSHAWLEKNGVIVDITSDQFPGCPKVYVGEQNDFYKNFCVNIKQKWSDSLDGHSIETDSMYSSAYRDIIKNIATKNA